MNKYYGEADTLKKYLLILSGMELGGAEKQAISFAKYLKNSGRYVTILGLTDEGRVSQICAQERIECMTMSAGNRLTCRLLSWKRCIIRLFTQREFWVAGEALMRRLAQYIRVNEYDVCISYCTYANTILGCTSKGHGSPIYVWYQRDAGIFDETDGYQKRAIFNMDYVLANGKSGQQWIKKAYGVEATVIYNGVSLKQPEKSRDEWRKAMHVEANSVVCTMIANLSSAKDHLSLIRLWREVLNREKDKKIFLILAGRFDNQYEVLKGYVERYYLEKRVIFLGQISDIEGLLYATDICVFGAKSEGNPNGVIEPALAGLPVVATDLPEIREIVAKENERYLFRKGDLEYAVNRLYELAENEELRKKLGEANRKKAQIMFSVEKNFQKIINLVERDSSNDR